MKLTQTKIKRIKKLYENNKSIDEIIKLLNISVTTIYKYLKHIPKQRRGKSKNPIIVPDTNENLGECIGIFYGDGTMWKERNCGRIRIRGNPTDEKEYYNNWVKPLFERTFDVKVIAKKFGETYGIEINSKELGILLNEKFNFPFGKKSLEMRIPHELSRSENAVIGFIRGLFDTDGYIYINIIPSKKGKTRLISLYLAFTSCNKSVLEQVKKVLDLFGFKTSKVFKDRSLSLKNPKFSLRLVWKENFFKYVQKIGFHNPRFLTKLNKVKEIMKGEKTIGKSYLDCLSANIRTLTGIKNHDRTDKQRSQQIDFYKQNISSVLLS